MIDIINKRCIHPNCDKRPSYNTPDEKIALYCANHKKDGMINITSKNCIHPDCNKQPLYNTPGEKVALYCGNHKKDGMIDIKHKRCILPDCNKIPHYNTPGEKIGLYCVTHKKDGMIDIHHKRCKLCPTYLSNKNYKGYCYRCYIHTFPDSPILRNHKTKERHVADYIKQEFPQYDFTFDKIIENGCSKRRPDILLDMGEFIIIIEIDENQHQTYQEICENKRLMEIFQDCGSRPLTMIRFNPDQYYINNKSIPSCWTITKDKGLCIVNPSKKIQWEKRLNTLKDEITSQINIENPKEINVVHLFYNKE